jgi:hypothetical protein
VREHKNNKRGVESRREQKRASGQERAEEG